MVWKERTDGRREGRREGKEGERRGGREGRAEGLKPPGHMCSLQHPSPEEACLILLTGWLWDFLGKMVIMSVPQVFSTLTPNVL